MARSTRPARDGRMAVAIAVAGLVNFQTAATSESRASRRTRSPASVARRRAPSPRKQNNSVGPHSGRKVADGLVVAGHIAWPHLAGHSLIHGRQDQSVEL